MNLPPPPSEDFFDQDAIGVLYTNSLKVMNRIRESAINQDTGKKGGPLFQISKAAQLVGRTASAIREAEKDGRLPPRERTETGRRLQYTLEDLDSMREVFGTRPWRRAEDPAAVISISNFKGGVGKSTTAIHLAQYLAIQGYRVCLIDCDSQATTTMMFGYVPDIDLGERDTLYGYIHDMPPGGLRSFVRKTHFYNLDLVPANLKLYNLEYEIAGYIMQNQSFDVIDSIAHAVETIVDDYDVIILDPPPALGMISLGVLTAANALVIPMPPSIIDFSSTASFLDMLNSTMKQMEMAYRKRPVYNFVKIVGSKADEGKSMHREILGMTSKLFGRYMLNSVLRNSAEIDNASSRMKTVYELERPVTSHEVHSRCLTSLNAVNYEIEQEILKTWSGRGSDF
ncbi:AAA family ATPase [Acidiphilium sp. PA]|uniref:AAA family ATPase n=1 Tax=Acidiphilium sp. PA TaxID=2871705 RepID=UPI002244B393|nr:AAA family ATPase [Acidiphilium sp. PA]MCW8309087.1 AAA family ATPase [Acidiphilium sp. PA]